MRSYGAYLSVFALLAIFGGFTWLTRNPDAEILERAEEWRYAGPWVSRFRAVYGGAAYGRAEYEPSVTPGVDGTTAEDAADAVPSPPPPVFDRHVWVLPGMELKARASADAATVYAFEKLARVGKYEKRGDWYRVYHLGWEGWVLLEGYDETAEIPYGEAPEPARPIAAREPEAEWLEAARQYLRGQERVFLLGDYTLFTDVPDDELIAYLGAAADQLDAVYAERYGREPLGLPAEGVVLYQSDIAYRLLQQRSERIAGLAAAGHNAKGLAVLYSGGRTREEVASTVVHELVHFINRRAIGPQLPPWLDEGIADNLAHSRIDEAGRIYPSELGGHRLKRGEERRFEGAYSSLFQLRQAMTDGSLPALPELMSTDWDDFVRTPSAQLHYAAASFWIRYLLDAEGGRHAAAFQAFLDAVAEGEPPTTDALGRHLGEDWSVLNARFRAWIEHLAQTSGLSSAAG